MEEAIQNLGSYILIITILILWSIPWKAVALWKAARSGQKGWFIVLVLVQTLAVLDILYIAFFNKDKK
jgi:hypothetical protein